MDKTEVRSAMSDAIHILVNDPNHDGVTERLMEARAEVVRQLSDTERLAMARQAWLRADRALKDMQRLHRYAKKTPAMKDDLARATGIYRHNTELHEKIMRGVI